MPNEIALCQQLTEAANHPCRIIQQLEHKLASLRKHHDPIKHFEDYENELHALFVQAERETLAEDLSGLDIDIPAIEVNGTCYHRALRCSQTYQSAAGPIRVARTLYRSGKDDCIVPLELRAGIVEGYWTPRAAKQAVWVVAQLSPGIAKTLLDLMGNMSPSESSLTRLPKKFNEQWEQYREPFECILKDSLKVPEEAVTVAASLDGVMLPMKDGKRQEKREQSTAEGKRTRGPAGCQEASCGTLSFYDVEGERLSTIRIGRMPESKKVTLKQSLSRFLNEALRQKPQLSLVKVADGAKDNWTYLAKELPQGHEIVDFYHAAEHLKKAFDLSYGENSSKPKEKFITYRHILKEESDGVEKVGSSLILVGDLIYIEHFKARMPTCAIKNSTLKYLALKLRGMSLTWNSPLLKEKSKSFSNMMAKSLLNAVFVINPLRVTIDVRRSGGIWIPASFKPSLLLMFRVHNVPITV